jgi:pimeloyl-ACP methyl ester carboxylesterase
LNEGPRTATVRGPSLFQERHMANYVLVHGAWGGNQSYQLTVRDLEAAGHAVLNCTLPGLGTRQDELHPGVTLADHVEAVCEQVAASSFERFILAGHSYGGMVITGVASRLGERIDAICYIDAFLPGDGESLWDVTGEFEHAWYIDTQKHKPGLIRPLLAPVDFEPVPGVVGYHPLLTLTEAVERGPAWDAIAQGLYLRHRIRADPVPALPRIREAGGVGVPRGRLRPLRDAEPPRADRPGPARSCGRLTEASGPE